MGALICLEKEQVREFGAYTMLKRFILKPGQPVVFDNFSPDPLVDPGPLPTCTVPNPTPRAPYGGSGLAPSGGGTGASLAAGLGAVLAGAALAIGSCWRPGGRSAGRG